MERKHDLHFELSNEDRLNILNVLKERPERLTKIAKSVEITNQQCVRHLKRLIEAKLISKTTENYYKLTPFGDISLQLNRGFSFIANNRNYFHSHSLTKLPDKFILRVGEFDDSWLTPDVMVSIGEFETILREADDFVNVIIDQRTPSVRPLVARAVERGVKINSLALIYRESYDRAQRDLVEYDERVILKGFETGKVESGDLDDSGIFIYMSEKAAFVCFPLEDGSSDYLGFSSTNSNFISLCSDIFDYYWSKAYIVPKNEMMNRIINYLNIRGLTLE
jgi:predicted transcriptional regulator